VINPIKQWNIVLFVQCLVGVLFLLVKLHVIRGKAVTLNMPPHLQIILIFLTYIRSYCLKCLIVSVYCF